MAACGGNETGNGPATDGKGGGNQPECAIAASGLKVTTDVKGTYVEDLYITGHINGLTGQHLVHYILCVTYHDNGMGCRDEVSAGYFPGDSDPQQSIDGQFYAIIEKGIHDCASGCLLTLTVWSDVCKATKVQLTTKE